MSTDHSKQVEVEHYWNPGYLSLVRTITHWFQANEIAKHCPRGSEILEIGPGCGHVGWILELLGLQGDDAGL